MAEMQSWGVCVLRLARLAADGTPLAGSATGAWVMCKIQDAQVTIDYQDGQEFVELDGCGNIAFKSRQDDQPKSVTINALTLLTADPRMIELALGGHASIIGPGDGTGFVINSSGCTQITRTGVSIEAWSKNQACNVPGSPPYIRRVVPRAYLRYTPPQLVGGLHKYVLSGWGEGNPNWGDGPFNDFPVLSTDALYAENSDTALPTCPSPSAFTPTPSSGSS